jgi:antitoxin component YwqK of YwqJK toxin-antitoxin module
MARAGGRQDGDEAVLMLRVDEDDLDWDDHNMPVCNGEPFTGESVEYGQGGRLLSLVTYVDGREDGPFRVWTNVGVLVVEGRSRHGTPVGRQREFCDDGAPKVEREYSDKGELLRLKRWNADGAVTTDETYQPTW